MFVGRLGEEDREEHGGAERATDLAGERRRGGGDPDVARADRVLHGEGQRLEVEAEPDAEEDHRDQRLPQRGVGLV